MESILNKVIKSVFVMALALPVQAQFVYEKIEYVDDDTLSTIGKVMHVCPAGYMSGFHNNNNDLLCFKRGAPNYTINTVGPVIDDYNTRRQGMSACPLGTAMVGIHVKDTALKCAQLHYSTIDTSSEYLNYGGPPTLRFNMHACPEGWVMTGVHVKNNVFLCSKVWTQYIW